jgi:hypothetical protein
MRIVKILLIACLVSMVSMATVNHVAHYNNVVQKRVEFKSCLASYENLTQFQKVKSTCNDFYCHVSYSQPELVDRLRNQCITKEEKLVKAQERFDSLQTRKLYYFVIR